MRILTDGGVVVLRCEHGGSDALPRLTLEDPGPTFGLALRAQRCPDPVPGVQVEVLRSGLCGDLCSVGAALVPDGGDEVVWLSAPERSDAGQILAAAVEVLRAATPAKQVSAPPVAAPRARVAQVGAWDAVVAPNGLVGGLPDGDQPAPVQRALGGAWSIVVDTAPDLPVEARLWLAHREQAAGDEVVRMTATWNGPGADTPWHVELHVSHRVEEAQTEFLVIDGSTSQDWVIADAVHIPGTPLTWRVHPAPRPDEASRTGEALYALITALAETLPAQA